MSKKRSRTTNTLFNFTSSIGGQLLAIMIHFVTRSVFIATLGKSYLGINGLFSNILTMLSLAEFGVGSAILFKLYDPLAKGDKQRIRVLMQFYKSAYRLIGLVVAMVGLCFIPFLPIIINDYDKLEALNINAVLIYCLFLLQTISSYLFFAYRSAILKADQREYLVNIIGYFFTIATAIIQTVTLYLFHSFILYVVISIVQVIFHNILCAILSDRLYPYIKEKTTEKLSREELKSVFKDCGALFIYKLNGVVLKATDNIVLSVFLGLDFVGLYSNYLILYTSCKSLYVKVFNSVSHSLGNLHTETNKKHEYKVFEAVMMITAILGGTAFVGIFICADELIDSWIGAEWVLAQPFALLMGLELYTLAFRAILSKYRTTMGLFQQAKWRPLFGMIINLVVSIVLVRYWGICGVLVGTIVADWTTMMWYDPMIIHKYGFQGMVSVKRYYGKYIKYFATVCAIGAIDYLICSNFLVGYKWFSVIIHAIICGITVPGVMIALNVKSEEGSYVFGLMKGYATKIGKKLNRRSK